MRNPFVLALTLIVFVAPVNSQKLPQPTRIWSKGPLTKSAPVMGITFGATGASMTGPHLDSQTSSIFAATRSMVFAGDRIIVASRVGMRPVDGAQIPAEVYTVISMDAASGEIKDKREFLAFGSLKLFATDDAHIIIAARKVFRLTADLHDDGAFEYGQSGHKFGDVQNISPDGSVIGNATSPGFEMLDTHKFTVSPITKEGAVATSVNRTGFITDNIHWIRDYPKDLGFVTYIDSGGERLLYHGKCGGRPQFLTDNLILEPGCKKPILINLKGEIVKELDVPGYFSYAGASQNGNRFALQLGQGQKERFLVFSTETGQPVTEIKAEQPPDEQSWTAFSPDGTLFAVGSPLKLTLYRLP